MALLPPDSDERIFLRVVEAGSLKAVAEQMGNDPSAISRRLSALEERLGQRLLRRSTRGSRPTEAGALYYEGLSKLVEQQDALEAEIAGASDEPQGILRVTAPPEFGVRFVVPVLQNMQHRYPELRIELALGTEFSDLAAEDIDVAIRIGIPRDSALTARRLGAVSRVVAASKNYLECHGHPHELEELTGHRVLGYRAGAPKIMLGAKAPDGSQREVLLRPHFTVNSMPTLVQMTEHGDGIYYGPHWAVAESLCCGRLVRLLEDYQFSPAPLHALYRDRHYLPAKVRHFIDRMETALRTAEAL